jgi:hypothetical protein
MKTFSAFVVGMATGRPRATQVMEFWNLGILKFWNLEIFESLNL